MNSRRIVVVGAGGSGMPLAARLAATHDVVLLESGSGGVADQDEQTRAALDDARTVRAGMPDGPVSISYEAELFPGRRYRIARGRLVGGSSAVNGAYFQRPHPDDFRAWEASGGTEWSYESCLPALRRLESDLDFGDSPMHGSKGPVPVQRWGADDLLTTAFIAAVESHGGLRERDKNGGGRTGVGLLPRNALGARRWSVARAYRGLLGDVDVRANAHVSRILIRDGVAHGVEIEGAEGHRRVQADEVILCGGAIETPRLLMASGVGDPGRLAVPIHASLAGVGRGLSDHPAISIPWIPREGVAPTEVPAAWSAAWNSPAAEVADGAFEILFAVASTASIVSGRRDAPGVFDLRVSLSTPLSRGEVFARGSGVDIRYGYLEHRADLRVLQHAVRAGVRVLREGPLADVVAEADLPGWVSGAERADDADVWLHERLGTALHSCGTARMGDRSDPFSVVDPHGRVHGITGLRVADSSILPAVPSRGTALTAVMTGERIAELIRTE